MKQISILLLFIIALSCKEENKKIDVKDIKKSIVTNFLKDVKSLENNTLKNPVKQFKKEAKTSVREIIKINKDNIIAALKKAEKFKYAVVIVEDHTIVKITNLENCKPSGSWSACMPKGEGYIKKGVLVYQNNYINNVIGLPDNQERLLYLF